MMISIPDEQLALGSLVALLEKINAPTFIAREDGVVRFNNGMGGARRQADPAGLEAELRAAIRGQPAGGAYACTRTDVPGWFLVSAIGGATEHCVERARHRFGLTRRQREVLDLVIGGATNRTIASLLGITARTVEVHLSSIYERAGVENRASLVSLVLRAA